MDKSDIEAVSIIYTINWKSTYKGILPNSFLDEMTYIHSAEKWLTYINTAGKGGFVAVNESSEIIGFAAYKPSNEFNNVLLLDSLHISPTAQGRGIGKKLIFKVGSYALDYGYSKMSICIVKGNDRAEKIYTHLGAKFYKEFIDDFEGTASFSSVLVWHDLTAFKTNDI